MAPKDQKSVPIFNDAVQIQVRNRVLNNQSEEISKNERLIENADADLTTLRRQVEIIEDSSLRKANHLFLLKTVLTMVGLSFILVLLTKQNLLPEPYGTYSLYAIIVIFLYVIYANLSSARARNKNRFSLRDFFTKGDRLQGRVLPKRTCLAKTKSTKTPEEIELENKLARLHALELKFNRVKPTIDIIDSRAKTATNKIDEIKSEYRDVFGESSDRAIEIALRNHMDKKGVPSVRFGI
jgi:hypothetical protein